MATASTGPAAAIRTPASPRFLVGTGALCFLAALVFYFPGSLGWDATVQWHDARTGRLTSHHPPFMSFLWHWLDQVVPGPGLMLALELAAFWAAAVLLAHHARALRALAVAGFLALAANPLAIAHAALVEKNVLGGNLALLGWAILFGYEHARRRWLLLLLAGVSFAAAGLVRFQLWIVVAPALALIAFIEVKSRGGLAWLRPVAVTTGVVVFAVLLVQVLMQTSVDLRPSTDRNWRQVMLYDIGAVIAAKPDIEMPVFAQRGIDLGELRARVEAEYTPFSMSAWTEAGRYALIADSIGEVLGEPSVKHLSLDNQLPLDVFSRQWRALMLAEPQVFLQTRVRSFLRLLGIGGSAAQCWPLTVVGFLGKPEAYWAALNGATFKEPYSTVLLRARIFPANTLFFRPVIYLGMSIVLIAILLWRSQLTAPTLCLLISAWIYWLTFLPFNADCEVRYSYFPCTAILFVVAFEIALMLRSRAAGPISGQAGSKIPDA